MQNYPRVYNHKSAMSLCREYLIKMERIKFAKTSRGSDCIFDDNNCCYYKNSSSSSSKNQYWKCQRCPARLTTSKSSNKLIGIVPEHAHSENGLLKRKAADVENENSSRSDYKESTQRNKFKPTKNQQWRE